MASSDPENPNKTEDSLKPSQLRRRLSRVLRRADPLYDKVMDDLEDEEEESSGWAKAFVVLEAVVLLALVATLVVTVTVEGVKGRRFVRLRLWQWVALVIVIISGLSAVRFFTFLVFTPAKCWWRVHRYVVYILEEIKWCVDVTIWLGLVLVAWYLWFRPRLMHSRGNLSLFLARQATRLLIALVLGSFLWTLKNVLYLKLKADLHYDQLYQRIRYTVIDFHGIQIIHHKKVGDGKWKFLTSDKNKLNGTTGKNIWMEVHKMTKETVPIWVLRQLSKVYLKQMNTVGLPRNRDVTKGDKKLMTEALQMLKEIITDRDGRIDISTNDMDKYDLSTEERDYLFELVKNREQKEQQTQEDSQVPNKVISRDQFLSWAVVAYKNCWGLERTLHSSERVFIKLNRIMSTFLLTVMLIIWLLLSTIVDTAQLALLFTPFIAASFIFGDTSKKMFEGLIFTFAMHPFDVGDRVVIENVQMKVTELNILTSVFFKYDTGEEVVYPNSLLASTKIINLDITPDQADMVEFTIPSSTLLEDITDLELKIKKALDDDITYSSHTKVVKKEVTKDDIKMVIYFKYLVSYLAAESKATHKSNILTKVMEFKKEMESNVNKASSSISVGTWDFTLNVKVTMKEMDELKKEMLGEYERNKNHYSKVLMKGLHKDKIEMAVHLRLATSEDTDKLKQYISRLYKARYEQRLGLQVNRTSEKE